MLKTVLFGSWVRSWQLICKAKTKERDGCRSLYQSQFKIELSSSVE